MSLKLGELFAGYGGLGLAVEEVFGAELAWYAEFDPAPSRIMAHHWPHLTNYGDVTKIDWATVPPVDIISGGSPCQDLSLAGARKGMTNGTRSNLWESMREAIATIKPTYVIWENVRGALSAKATSASDMEPGGGPLGDGSDDNLRALGRVLGDLADLGMDAGWCGVRAADAGAPHGRYRIFVLAVRRDAIPHPRGSGGNEAVEHDGRGAEADNRASVPNQPDREPLRAGPIGGATIQDADLTTGSEWRIPTPGQTESGWARPDAGGRSGTPAANTGSDESERRGRAGNLERPARTSEVDGEERERVREATSDSGTGNIDWGVYAPAIRRWEAVRGTSPAPTELTPKGKHRLSPRFTEWMMGLPDGWVTNVPGISRNDMLKACGNGVVPQQAALALRRMLRSRSE